MGLPMSSGETSIAIVDDHPVVVEGIKSALLTESWLRVLATGRDADDAVRIAAELSPDVMLIDVSMPGDVFNAIARITQTSQTKVVVFTAFSSLESALRSMESGALGFVLKGADFDELIHAIQAVLRSEPYIAQPFASQILISLRTKLRPDTEDKVLLSSREKQIVDQLLHAKTNREIAANLSISEKTVKRCLTMLMKKLHARNRVELAVNAQRTVDWQLTDPMADQR
jgi:two-component system nitrate/nitrite response regulator NarL